MNILQLVGGAVLFGILVGSGATLGILRVRALEGVAKAARGIGQQPGAGVALQLEVALKVLDALSFSVTIPVSSKLVRVTK